MSLQKDAVILEAYITETSQMVEALETMILECEYPKSLTESGINEIFRIMHTIKGSSSMMQFDNMATLSHALEDLFSFLREHQEPSLDGSVLSNLMLEGVDFIKAELYKIINGGPADGDASIIIQQVERLLLSLNEKSLDYKAVVFFTSDCGMEHMRAFQLVHTLVGLMEEYSHIPEDLDDEASAATIREQGFQIILRTKEPYKKLHKMLSQTCFLRHLDLELLTVPPETMSPPHMEEADHPSPQDKKHPVNQNHHQVQSINVHVNKLDELMDLVGELVIAEAMVTQIPDVIGLQIEQFQKASRNLQKITKEIQGKVMEIRMVPLAATFQRMHRIVRDMSKKLGKTVDFVLLGEETEVDKKVIEHISDPLMHLVRNAVDHGLESSQERLQRGKPEVGTLSIEAKNADGEVMIIVKDDGRGLDREKIIQKAKENQVLYKSETEMTDKEIYNLIYLPGFSTKENITEFSGRGVGLDVVTQNIGAVGGTILIDSVPGAGTTITIRIPLTLAIIDGMIISVGASKYTIPTTSVKEFFKPKQCDLIIDPAGGEMILVRGHSYPILRLHQHYSVPTDIDMIMDGILIMVELEESRLCIFADQLIGQHQVVVKALPSYLRSLNKVEGISGCTLLGDGDISLILDVQGLLHRKK